MPKRTFKEFAEFNKEFTPKEFVEHLKLMGGSHYEQIISDPKIAEDAKKMNFRTTKQLYVAFEYLRSRRSYDCITNDAVHNWWLNTMAYLDLPLRQHVRSLPRDLFIACFEHAMIRTYHDIRAEKTEKGGFMPPMGPSPPKPRPGCLGNHKDYVDVTISAKEWSVLVADRGAESQAEKDKLRKSVLAVKFNEYFDEEEEEVDA